MKRNILSVCKNSHISSDLQKCICPLMPKLFLAWPVLLVRNPFKYKEIVNSFQLKKKKKAAYEEVFRLSCALKGCSTGLNTEIKLRKPDLLQYLEGNSLKLPCLHFPLGSFLSISMERSLLHICICYLPEWMGLSNMDPGTDPSLLVIAVI